MNCKIDYLPREDEVLEHVTKLPIWYERGNSVPYHSVDGYVLRQFDILREDCFRDLKIGLYLLRERHFNFLQLEKYENGEAIRPSTLKLWTYDDVTLSDFSFRSDDIVYKIQFKSCSRVDWLDTKRLRYGSLLCLSCDDFQTFHFATVADSTTEELKTGCVTIQFLKSPLIERRLLKKQFRMIETQAFYESYVHILRQLKRFTEDTFPFPKYFLQNEVLPRTSTYYKLYSNHLNSSHEMDSSQKNAYLAALKQNISLIQGPPGTGKSTVGFYIVERILQTYSLSNMHSPILIVCYTNHALDQFLEKILDSSKYCTSEDLVRVGSMSESSRIQSCNINKFVSRWITERKFPYDLAKRIKDVRQNVIVLKNVFKENKENISSSRILEYESLLKTLRRLRMEQHRMVMQVAKIVGMTTTACARYGKILKDAGFKVVLIEEAAEILEAHVICSLTKNCKQLIMIGDHKQLPPRTAVYDFEELYDMNVSLFERLVRNRFPCQTLTVQRRMRPEISKCISSIYPDLTDHPYTKTYNDVEGCRTNIYFYDHSEPEQDFLESSYSNGFEVKFIKALCDYFMDRGISSSKITVLTAYKGQQILVRQSLKDNKYENIEKVVIDGYQGEENDIIILSLVRSKRIGFLKKANRICVALSRARRGFFMVGNMNLLSMNSSLWKQLKEILGNNCGHSIPSICKRNMNHDCWIKNIKDFTREDICKKICGQMFTCGQHKCEELCHDDYHERCPVKVSVWCPQNRHVIGKKCYERITCSLATRTKLSCNHFVDHLCDEEPPKCNEMLFKELKCGHVQMALCTMDVTLIECVERLKRQLLCGHQKLIKCSQKMDIDRCDEVCGKEMTCGHLCKAVCVACDGGRLHQPCLVKINYQFSCGHSRSVQCYKSAISEIHCLSVCGKEMACGHMCKNDCSKCFKNENHGPCKQFVTIKLTCDHFREVECHLKHTTFDCFEKCGTVLPCNHLCQGTCLDCKNTGLHSICKQKLKIRLLCQHFRTVECHLKDISTFNCTAPCSTRLPCGHECDGVCSECQKSSEHKICEKVISVQLPCSHFTLVSCYAKHLKFECLEQCSKRLPCNHICSYTCHECYGGRLHKICRVKCNKTLICGHNCRNSCHSNACKNCVSDCFFNSIKNWFTRSTKVSTSTLQLWKNLLSESEMFYDINTALRDLIDVLSVSTMTSHSLKSVEISFQYYKRLIGMTIDVSSKFKNDNVSVYRNHILSSVKHVASWLDPFKRDFVSDDISSLEMEFNRLQDLILIGSLIESIKTNNICSCTKLLDEIVDSVYDKRLRIVFSEKINVLRSILQSGSRQ